MATKIGLYNTALAHLGSSKISSLSEAQERRYDIDTFYDGAVKWCLEQGFWKFGKRAIVMDSSTSVSPEFGYQYAFTKPQDLVRVYQMSANAAIDPQLVDDEIIEEAGYWFTNCDPLYVIYISNNALFGMDLSKWPETFTSFVDLTLAVRACRKITGSDEMLQGSEGLLRRQKKAKEDALSKDAMAEPTQFPPNGSWTRARRGGFRSHKSRWDGTGFSG